MPINFNAMETFEKIPKCTQQPTTAIVKTTTTIVRHHFRLRNLLKKMHYYLPTVEATTTSSLTANQIMHVTKTKQKQQTQLRQQKQNETRHKHQHQHQHQHQHRRQGHSQRCEHLTSHLLFALLMCLLISTFNICLANAADSLSGDLQSCSNEGEEVPIKGIRNSKCYKCTCQNGFVNCDKESCPSIDDCYLLDQKSPDTCCRRCKGCVFQGKRYASGTEWSDPIDACRTYKCVSSVVTETIMKCYTQCDGNQILPPSPGECCPRCQGCKINGQIVAEGQEVVGSIDDRCLVCQCTGQNLTCAKKTCPILQCPMSKQKHFPNECCPRCTEHRELMPLPGKCIYNINVYYNKTQFTPDRCTNCTCINGTSVCQRATCPILECSPEYQETDGCCPRCITSEVRSECIYNGITYLNNETWNLGPCRSCRCTAGNIRCSEMRCPAIRCRPNEELKVVDGECCAKCIETDGICTVFGDPHFKTFDGKFFSFQGSCKYLLTADCLNHTFSIRLTNDGRGTNRSSWAKTVTLKLKNVRINLGQKLRVKVNGSRIVMPYSHGAMFNITRNAETIFLETQLGLNVEWDGNNFLQVIVPSSYKYKLCGLCGNFNGIVRDDLTSRDNYNHSEVWRFANSWKVGGPKACSRNRESIAIEPTCKQRISNAYCRPLQKSEVFGHCGEILNPINYIESCKMDVCECPNGMCHCDSFAAYAHECRRLGVHLPDWRAATNCPVAVWRRNTTALALMLRDNPLYGDFGNADYNLRHGLTANAVHNGHQRKKYSRKKQQNKRQQQQKEDYITKHVPKNLLLTKKSDSTPPPLH